ncbi:MAG TPA: hypothetical protein EYO33_27285 [Phycisphaerales bacterium]|nr:hypothetical protein [Phycisphaerales bacterium]
MPIVDFSKPSPPPAEAADPSSIKPQEWVHATPDPDDGWSYPPRSGPDSSLHDDVFADEEEDFAEDDWFEDDPEYVNPVKTVRVSDVVKKKHQAQFQWLGLVAVSGLVLLGIALFPRGADKPKAVAATPQTAVVSDKQEALESADIWLKSALDSVDTGDYDLAQSQLEKTLDFLKTGGAEDERIERVQRELAGVLTKRGDLLGAYRLWERLAQRNSSYRSEFLESEKKLLEQAGQLLSSARASLDTGDAGTALRKAREASKIYNTFGGRPEKKAEAYHLIGRSQAFQGNIAAASDSFRRAQQFVFSSERKEILMKLKPERATTRPVAKKRPKLRLGNEHIPRAQKREDPEDDKRSRVKLDLDDKDRPELDLDPVDTEPDGPTRLGDRDVLDTYNNSSRNAGKPKGL